MLVLGLGVAAGAVLQRPAHAQVDTTRAKRDTTARRDTIAKTPLQRKDTAAAVTVPVPKQADSLLEDSLTRRAARRGAVPLPKDTVKKDTIKAPIAHAEAPPPLTASDTYIWDRNAIYATGAFTAQDLLDRVPGITGFRGGWIAAPQTSAYLGDVGRVRVFLDGVELDKLDNRMGGSLDLTQIQLWPLEEVRIERGASEVRMYLRSWRVDRTTPSTRTDISTGDQQTNMYRGYFGRRYGGGEVLQAGAQQYGTTPGFTGAASDQTSLMGRVGWAKKGLSVDGFMLRTSRHRGTIYSALIRGDSLLGIESTQSQAYLRAGWGDPDNGPWAQAIASTQSYKYTGTRAGNSFGSVTAADTAAAETTFVRPQYVLTGGFTRWGIQLSGAERLRSFFGERLGTPEVRASYTSRMLGLMAYSEGRSADSISRTELSGRVSPLSFISLSAALGHNTDHRQMVWHVGLPLRDTTRTASYARAEVGLRVHRLWVSGGMLHRDRVMLNAPTVYDSVLRRVMDPAANASYAAIRGNFYEDLYADITALRWSDTAGFYRPRYQTRSEVGIRTSWLSKFPSGNFGLHFAAIHEYRSNTWFPADTGSAVVPGSRTISSLLEIRILSAVAFFQMRNMLGERYGLVPRFQMPRQTTMYGVRWEFWN